MRVDRKLVASPGDLEAKQPKPSSTSAVTATAGAAAIVALSTGSGGPKASNPMVARIERVRELIQAGEYRIDLDALASRIADDDILRSTKP